jgi:ABC-type transporter Mla maintaining outer membrane lipid asymmetry ATPase subunit MlaF
VTPPVLELVSVSKSYGALRPLRMERLAIAAGEHVALMGPDQPAAEVLINLVTGASLPDTGYVRVFGHDTTDITDSAEWLAGLDRFGIVSDRAALLEPLTVIQNLAVPFSLEIEPPSDAVRRQAAALGSELHLDPAAHDIRVGDLDPIARLRLRVARALAFNPLLLLLEHPSKAIPPRDSTAVARDIRHAFDRRGASALTITADRDFGRSVAHRVLVLEPSTGRLKAR